MAHVNGIQSVMSSTDISLNFDDLNTNMVDSEDDQNAEDGAPNLVDLIMSRKDQESSESDSEFGIENSVNHLSNTASQLQHAMGKTQTLDRTAESFQNEQFNINITDSLDLAPDNGSLSQSDNESTDGQPSQPRGPVISLDSGAVSVVPSSQTTKADQKSQQVESIFHSESDNFKVESTSKQTLSAITQNSDLSSDGQFSLLKDQLNNGNVNLLSSDSIPENKSYTEKNMNNYEFTEKKPNDLDFDDDNTEIKVTNLREAYDGGFDAEFEVPEHPAPFEHQTVNNSAFSEVRNINVVTVEGNKNVIEEYSTEKDISRAATGEYDQGRLNEVSVDGEITDKSTTSKNSEIIPPFVTDNNAVLQRLKASGLVDDTPKDFTEASATNRIKNEWDEVQVVEAAADKDSRNKPKAVSTPLLLYVEAVEKLSFQDYSEIKPNIKPETEKRGFAFIKNFLFGPPKLSRDLIKERDLVFCLAASGFENGNNIHIKTLQSIYRSLTGSKFDCRRFGSHWEEIGFQGNDPSTDLRAVGILGLLQLLYILTDKKKKTIAEDIYKLSLHPSQNFPFCVMSLNMTKITMQCLRDGGLNRDCNRLRRVFPVVNDFFVGVFLHLYQIWKSQGKTIADSGFVIKDIEKFAKKGSRVVLNSLEQHLNKKKESIAVDVEGEISFLDVCDTKDGNG